MRDYTMDLTKEAAAQLRARIKEGKEKDYPKLELKRQLRCKLSAEEGRRVAIVVDKLW